MVAGRDIKKGSYSPPLSSSLSVPPNQAVLIYDALRDRSVPTALIMYKGEQHGFRSAASIRSAYDSELYFYGKVLGFAPAGIADDVELPDVKNVVSVPQVSVE